jgi:hypothetical protein
VITDIPPGTYMVGVTMAHPERRETFSHSGPSEPTRGGVVDGWTTVEVSRGIAMARIEIREPAVEGACIAWIIGPDGRLLDNLDLALALRHDDGKRPSPRQLSIDWDRRADGTYLVIPKGDDVAGLLAGEEPGSLELVAKHGRLGEARGAVRPGSAPVAEVSFQEPGRLEVVVSGSDDGQLAMRVQTELGAPSGAATRPARLGPASIEGMRIAYDRIAPGDYEARVTFACGSGATLDLHSGALSIASGETARLEVRIPEVHLVELRSAEGVFRRDELVIRGEGIRLRIGFGRRELLYLPPGAYEVVPRDGWGGTEGAPMLKFQVPETKTIEIPREEER